MSWPTTFAFFTPSDCVSSWTRMAAVFMSRPPVGMAESPMPGRSGAITVNVSASSQMNGLHISDVCVYPCSRTTAGNLFFRDGDKVFRTYFINNRGDEAMGTVWNYLDATPLGRQELWEDSPDGYPQTPPYKWWNWHDNYEAEKSVDPRWAKVSDAGEAAFRNRQAGAQQ